jgi:hypothetical protein
MKRKSTGEGRDPWGKALILLFVILGWWAIAQAGELTVQERLGRIERALMALEERLGKIESDLKSRPEKAAQERKEDVQGFLQSQASLSTKLDELTAEARLVQGRSEEIGHGISELGRRVDDFGVRLDQLIERMSMMEAEVSRAGSIPGSTSASAGTEHSNRPAPSSDEGSDFFEKRSLLEQLRGEEKARQEAFIKKYQGKRVWMAPHTSPSMDRLFWNAPTLNGLNLKKGMKIRSLVIKELVDEQRFQAWIKVILDVGVVAFVRGSEMWSRGSSGIELNRHNFWPFDPQTIE